MGDHAPGCVLSKHPRELKPMGHAKGPLALACEDMAGGQKAERSHHDRVPWLIAQGPQVSWQSYHLIA